MCFLFDETTLPAKSDSLFETVGKFSIAKASVHGHIYWYTFEGLGSGTKVRIVAYPSATQLTLLALTALPCSLTSATNATAALPVQV